MFYFVGTLLPVLSFERAALIISADISACVRSMVLIT